MAFETYLYLLRSVLCGSFIGHSTKFASVAFYSGSEGFLGALPTLLINTCKWPCLRLPSILKISCSHAMTVWASCYLSK